MAELVRAQELLARGERAVRGDANNLAQAVAEHADGALACRDSMGHTIAAVS